MKSKISILIILTLMFTSIFGTFAFADSYSSSIKGNVSNSMFLKQMEPLINDGYMQITKSEIGQDGISNFEIRYTNGLKAIIKEQRLVDGKTQLSIAEGTKNDIIIYNPKDNSYLLNGKKVTETNEVDNNVKADNSSSAFNSIPASLGTTPISAISDLKGSITPDYVSGSDPISNWTLKSTTNKSLDMGNILNNITITAIVYILVGFTGLLGVTAAIISFLFTAALETLPAFLNGSKIYAKQYYYVGTTGTDAFYSKYKNSFYLNSTFTTYANCYHVDIYYRGIFSYGYYYTAG